MSMIDPGFATFLLYFVQRCFYKPQDLYCNALRCITKEYCHKQGVSNLYFWCGFIIQVMKRTPNRCQRFPLHESFSNLRKLDFPNIWNGGWLSSVSVWSPSLFSLTRAISSARRLHVSLLFHPCSIGHLIQSVLAKYDKIILKDD